MLSQLHTKDHFSVPRSIHYPQNKSHPKIKIEQSIQVPTRQYSETTKPRSTNVSDETMPTTCTRLTYSLPHTKISPKKNIDRNQLHAEISTRPNTTNPRPNHTANFSKTESPPKTHTQPCPMYNKPCTLPTISPRVPPTNMNSLLKIHACGLRRRPLRLLLLHGHRPRRSAPDHESFYSTERRPPCRAVATPRRLRL